MLFRALPPPAAAVPPGAPPGPRGRAGLLGYLAPAVLVVVAVGQAVLTQTQDLTPWKGGGFGMFASVDRLQHRAVRVHLQTQDGRVLAVPSLEAGGSDVQDLAVQVQAMPSAGALTSLATRLGGLTWTAADLGGVEVAVPEDQGAAASAGTGGDTTQDGRVTLAAVRVEVVKLGFDADDVRVSAITLADLTRPVS